MMQRVRLNASALLASLEAHLARLERRHRAASISWHFERDSIPYALETDWPVGAAGFEPLHIESEFAKTLSPGGRTQTCASRIQDA